MAAPGGPQALFRGHVEDPGEEVNRPVRGVGGLAEPEVERRHLLAGDRRHQGLAERGHEVPVDGGPVEHFGPRLAAHRDVLLEVPRGKLRHRDLGGHRRRRRRLLPRLDAGDDRGRPATRLSGRDRPVAPDRDPPGPPLPPALDHVDLGARGVDPHPEAGEVPIPEDRVPSLDAEPVDGPLGELPAPGYPHGTHREPSVARRGLV